MVYAKQIFLFITIFFFVIDLFGKLTIEESVSHFRYPRFSDSGNIDWVMEGKSGQIIGPNIDINKLIIRLYSSDNDNRQIGIINSNDCTLDTTIELAHSKDSIDIIGAGFNLRGHDWNYDLNSKSIKVNKNSVVEFSESIGHVFSKNFGATGTTIYSDSLSLIIEKDNYSFIFKGSVELISDTISLYADNLSIELLNNSKKVDFLIPSGELSGINSINASGNIEFKNKSQHILAQSLTLMPQSNEAYFEKDAQISIGASYLKGDYIFINNKIIEVKADSGELTEFSFNDANSLNIDNSHHNQFLDNTKIKPSHIRSKSITFDKNNDHRNFNFHGSVFFESYDYIIHSDSLIIETMSTNEENEEISYCNAKGNVLVKNNEFKLTGSKLDYFPLDNEIKVEGSIDYISSLAKFSSEIIVINNNEIHASSGLRPMSVILPNTKELGFEIYESDDSAHNNNELIVLCSNLDIKKADQEYYCNFYNNVKIDYGMINLKANSMDMIWENDVSNSKAFNLNNLSAKGHIEMSQGDYFAKANSLNIDPGLNIVTLIGEAYFEDQNGAVYGDIIDYDRTSKKTRVRNESPNSRTKIKFNFLD